MEGPGQGGCVVPSAYTAEKVGSARLYFGTQYIRLTILDLQCLARIFLIVQQKLRDYTIVLPGVLLYVTSSVTSVKYVVPLPNASDHIVYPYLFEKHMTAVLIYVSLLLILINA